jgi:hypothetical protein
MTGVTVAPEAGWHRVLVIANRGLEEPALCAEVSAGEHAHRLRP